ncbi:MAG: hypothetical protein MUF87_06805 [Anaerolineae bacterium]|jgi:hypothetical protein|nr:hypothetical protein [Anaerolineae bacterium]
MKRIDPRQGLISPAWIVGLAIVTLFLILGLMLWLFASFGQINTAIRIEILEERFRLLSVHGGSRVIYRDSVQQSGSRCGSAALFEIYVTNASLETIETHYTRQFQQRAWVQDPRTGSVYPDESMRLDLLMTVPTVLEGVRLPPNIAAAQTPNTRVYGVILRGWDGTRCPELNRSQVLGR